MGEEAGQLEVKYDVVVVGGGPAGCAAAIGARRNGARVLLLDRDVAPRDRPGETLHPGIEPLLDRLGVATALEAATTLRHEGHWVRSGPSRRFQSFGSDARGPWLGFQVRRSALETGLRVSVAAIGVDLREGVAVAEAIGGRGGRVGGVVTAEGERIPACVVIDAAGSRHWLARQLHIAVRQLSPRYIGTFGYVSGAGGPGEAEFARHADGWTWIAPLGAGRWHWTRLSFAGKRMPRDWRPPALRGLLPEGPSRGADLTWRVTRVAAGPGWLLAGDAAAVLDPASSHGVLRALLTGFRAGQMAAERAETAATAYDAWLRAGVGRDADTLRSAYAGGPGRDDWTPRILEQDRWTPS